MVKNTIQWHYALMWRADTPASEAVLYRISDTGHRYKWAVVALPAAVAPATVDQVLEEMYTAVLALMEATA